MWFHVLPEHFVLVLVMLSSDTFKWLCSDIVFLIGVYLLMQHNVVAGVLL